MREEGSYSSLGRGDSGAHDMARKGTVKHYARLKAAKKSRVLAEKQEKQGILLRKAAAAAGMSEKDYKWMQMMKRLLG